MKRVNHIKEYRRAKQSQSFVRQLFKGVIRIVLLLAFIVLVYYVTRLEMFTLSEIEIEGGETISHETLRGYVEEELEGAYFRLIPKRFTYLFPHDRIVYVLEHVPRVHDVNIERLSRNKLKVTFEEYTPHALWCQHESTTTPCYFLDVTGYAFAEAPLLHGGALTRHYMTIEETPLPGQVIDDERLASIDTFIKRAGDALSFRINAITYMHDEDVTFWVNGGGSIQASLKRDLGVTLENVTAALESDAFHHIEPGNFNYIDARFENKIFINEEIATSSEETTELSE